MSQRARETLEALWKPLQFAQVTRVMASEPEDVLSMAVLTRKGRVGYHVESCVQQDVPTHDRDRVVILWNHYYGFADNKLFFQRADHCALDLERDLTLTFGRWPEHYTMKMTPPIGAWVGGVIDQPQSGLDYRLSRWFVCDVELMRLVRLVRDQDRLSDSALAARLCTPATDIYWAIARLVQHDLVEPFVHDWLSLVDPDRGAPEMRLPIDPAECVHKLSHTLGEPRWWQLFQEHVRVHGLNAVHPLQGGICLACESQRHHDIPQVAYA